MTLTLRLESDGLHIDIPEGIGTWASNTTDSLSALASQILNDCETANVPISSSSFILPAGYVANWPENLSRLANLPPSLPFPLDLRLSAGLGRPGSTINFRWMRVGSALALVPQPELDGPIARLRDQIYRVTNPYWNVLKLVSEFNRNSNNPNNQFEVWAEIRKALGDDLSEKLPDVFLRSLRVISADAFTLNFSKDSLGDPDIIPKLMIKHPDPTGQGEDGGPGTATGKAVLLQDDELLFVSRLDALSEGQNVFPLRDGTFISVTPELAKQLTAVKKVRSASPSERRQMVLNPTGVLREILGGEQADSVQLDFIETDKYSDRVTTLAAWVPPIVPWVKIPPIDWRGATNLEVGFTIGDKEVHLTHEGVTESIQTVIKAIEDQQDTAVLTDGTQVPATESTLKGLRHLEKALSDSQPNQKPFVDQENNGNLVLVIETNFEQEDFNRIKVNPRPGLTSLPGSLATEPKQHQEIGIRWLQEHWLKGSKGCLLADDMGLGKTYQALAFLAWVKELMNDGVIPQKPLLVVAPVGLLVNWEKEQDLHIRGQAIGAPLRAYGKNLAFLKRGSQRTGTATLDTVELNQASWILANYEAISEYQLSFGAINFAAVVFDEAQKIKSPSTAMTSAAKALNADFVLAMTGTPVENRLADLWCIADTCQPYSLKDIRSFSQKYENNPQNKALLELRDHIWQQEEHVGKTEPKMMLRRLKSEKLRGLPKKSEHVIRKNMPDRQLAAYRQATALNDIRGPIGTLGLIQSLRQISLHPGLFDGNGFDPADSARFQAMVEILDEVHSKNEKALVFIESLEIQAANQLPLLLQKRYRLKEFPMVINGSVGTDQRQLRVDEFQTSDKGFDVMLLSPKAGGVGLTLTAANHVIHLSRWWNPAVEDQCSDRAYRIGQNKDVHIYYPIAINPDRPEHSFDLKLNELMHRKRELSRTMLAPMEFQKEDYEELLKGITQ